MSAPDTTPAALDRLADALGRLAVSHPHLMTAVPSVTLRAIAARDRARAQGTEAMTDDALLDAATKLVQQENDGVFYFTDWKKVALATRHILDAHHASERADLAALVRRLAYRVRHDGHGTLARQAATYLIEHGLEGDPMRDQYAVPPDTADALKRRAHPTTETP